MRPNKNVLVRLLQNLHPLPFTLVYIYGHSDHKEPINQKVIERKKAAIPSSYPTFKLLIPNITYHTKHIIFLKYLIKNKLTKI